jgi:hypothetical protein
LALQNFFGVSVWPAAKFFWELQIWGWQVMHPLAAVREYLWGLAQLGGIDPLDRGGPKVC